MALRRINFEPYSEFTLLRTYRHKCNAINRTREGEREPIHIVEDPLRYLVVYIRRWRPIFTE